MSNCKVLVVDEWQKIPLVGPGAPISVQDAWSLLERWQIETRTDPESYFNLTSRHLVPKNWSGVLPSSNVQLEVRPAGATGLNKQHTEVLDYNIGLMLQAAVKGRDFVFPDANLSQAGDRLHAIIAGFLALIAKARQSQVLRQYKVNRASTRSVMGRTVFPAQLVEEIRRPGNFVSEWVSLDEDRPENKFLKAILILLRPLVSGQLRARLELQLVSFEYVTEAADPRREWQRIRFDRLSPTYSSLLRLGKAILDREAPGLFSGSLTGASEIVFTARAFESFIGLAFQAVAPKFGFVASLQENAFLGTWIDGGRTPKSAFEVVPDVQLFSANSSTSSMVLDTKWKRLRPQSSTLGVGLQDVYQVVTYAARFEHDRAVLLYPWMGKERLAFRTVEINSAKLPVKVTIATIPLLDPGFGNLEKILTEIIELVGH